ncbi:hypothetical protein TL16_g06104 [Triparma laevis f. inornata]|uniref:Uncharacterized protein n=1 Tax=Triparma laevis f. inornata TaxID=1714386 RepID=A0A9W7E9C9_9STRA|nr:hypothetical protein TL16_g06104 [Triparma laevis f. inornata]
MKTPASSAYNDHLSASTMPGFRYENPHLPAPPTVTKVDYDHSHLPPPDHSYYQPDVDLKAEAARASAHNPVDKHSYELGLKDNDNRDTYLDPLGEPDHYEHRLKTYYKRSPERIKALTPKYEPPRLYENSISKKPTATVAGVPTEHQPYKKGNIIEHRTLRKNLTNAPSHSNSTPDLLNPTPVQPPPPPTPQTEGYKTPGWIESSKMKGLLNQDVYIKGGAAVSVKLEKSETVLREGGKKHLVSGRPPLTGAAGVPTSTKIREHELHGHNAKEGLGGKEIGVEIFKGTHYPNNSKDDVGKQHNFKDGRFNKKFCDSHNKNKVSQIVFG